MEQADEKEDDFVKGFKVANFEIIDSPDKGTWLHPCLLCAINNAPFQGHIHTAIVITSTAQHARPRLC